jgi:hypothetical protein
MSRQDRLKEYANPTRAGNWNGSSRDQADLDRWSKRAAAESQCAPRASDGPMKLPSTKVNQRDSDMKPYRSQADSMRTKALADLNIEGDSPFMRSVRRQD